MTLFRKFFYRKPPDGLLEISERVYVFDCCFSTDVLEEDNYKVYMGGIVHQLREHLPESSFVVFNFREGERQSQLGSFLSEYDMTVMDYPRHYEGCPLLTMEVIHHFLKSSESWLSLAPQNVLLMHCERGGWPVLAFMLAALLIYRKQFTGEQKTLNMIYKQAPRELMQLLSPLDPLPSQLRYLHYVSMRNVGFEWPPLDRALTLDCIILRILPDFNGEGGCRPIFRLYGQDPYLAADRTPKVLFSTPKKSKTVRLYKQADCELVKVDINCQIQGDVVLECICLDEDLEREEMMFRVMFNTAFIRSNILMLNRDEIDILWNTKDRFPKNFRAEVLLSEMDAVDSHISLESPACEGKDGLPMEAFCKVQEIFSSVDWLDPKGDVALNLLQKMTASNMLHEKLDPRSHQNKNTDLSQDTRPAKFDDRLKPAFENLVESSKPSSESVVMEKMVMPQEEKVGLQRATHRNSVPQQIPHSSPALGSTSPQSSHGAMSRYDSAQSAASVKSLLHDHAPNGGSDNVAPLSPSSSPIPLQEPKDTNVVQVSPLPAAAATAQEPVHTSASELSTDQLKPFPPPPPLPPPPFSSVTINRPAPPPPPPPRTTNTSTVSDGSPPPIPPPLPPSSSSGPSPSSKVTTSAPPPPPPPSFASKSPSGSTSHTSPLAPTPPPAPFAKGVPNAGGSSPTSLSAASIGAGTPVKSPTPAPPLSAPFKGQGLRTSPRQQSTQSKKSLLKPLHWLKLTRAMQGSLWAEGQKAGGAPKAPEFDMSELESLFSVAGPNSDRGSSSGKSRRASLGSKSDKVQLIDLRRAYNCEIMLTKVKIPLPDLMGSLLALDDSALDVDQVDNLIKFCPTTEEMELLKGYSGDKEKLGKCEQFFLELMQVPRVESKLRVFSFKIQFSSQVSDLRKNLNVVNSAAEEIRNSAKLKRIMQTILSLGNALNQGTARGSAIGFKLDSLLKLIDTRARNNKMTLMHYLCKVLADKLPELLDFQNDLVSLEAASKIQLKYLAEEMQAISKGLEKVEQELTICETDGPVSQTFRKTLNEFLVVAEDEVRSLTSIYSGVGRSADALAHYFGEDPARCPFEQVVSTLLNFVRMFVKAHGENCKQIELEKKKAQKEAENEKMKVGTPRKETEDFGQILMKKTQKEADSDIMKVGTPKKEPEEIGSNLLKQAQKEVDTDISKKNSEQFGQAMIRKTQKEAVSERMKTRMFTAQKEGESEKMKTFHQRK